MPNIFAISDTWFNRILDDNQETNVVDNNERLIKNWNDTVKPGDKVYVLGGFGIGELYHIIIRLKGEIHFLNNYFNSDEKMFIKEMKDSLKKSSDPEASKKVVFENNQIVILNDLDSVLTYYPIQEWPGKSSGTYCFHGFNDQMNINDHNITCMSSAWDSKPVMLKQVQDNITTFNSKL
jgi:calcineurin-like phosphoesterase family protein